MKSEQDVLDLALDMASSGNDYLEIKKVVSQYDLSAEVQREILDLVDEEIVAYQLHENKKRDYWISLMLGGSLIILGYLMKKIQIFGRGLDPFFYIAFMIIGMTVVFRGYRKFRQPPAKKPKFEKHKRFKRKL